VKLGRSTVVASLFLLASCTPARETAPAVIDMHLHALPANYYGPTPLGLCAGDPAYPPRDPSRSWPEQLVAHLEDPPCEDPVWSAESDEALRRATLDALDDNHVVSAVVSGPPDLTSRWSARATRRLIPGLMLEASMLGELPVDSVRRWFEDGRFRVLGEVTVQYGGIAPGDPALEPYLTVADELDVPVAIHVGPGPPGAPYLGDPGYRARLHSPLVLEEVLVRHPDLRVLVMHAGWPMLDDLLALLHTHPQVYVGTGALQMVLPRAEYHRYLRRIVEAGFGDRVVFGSDQQVWPGMIEEGIRAIRQAPFLTDAQKRDILHDNAARFLRLDRSPSDRAVGRADGR
jgi:predicted TIM-barrel fold metal-dependent hydrolase